MRRRDRDHTRGGIPRPASTAAARRTRDVMPNRVVAVVLLGSLLAAAHPVAPAPASAVLSGVVVKAGLLGMVRFVPPSSVDAPHLLIGVGLFSASYGALAGLCQLRLKTVLAYSTVSQMGLALAGFAAVQAGAAAPAAVGLFVLHHGLNKIALFIAAGHRVSDRGARALFLLPAASLAGLPLTSGMLAKVALKQSLAQAGADLWVAGLAASSALTTTLLLHADHVARAHESGREAVHPAWAAGSLAGLGVPWAWSASQGWPSGVIAPGALWDGLWPVLAGAAVYVAGRRLLVGRTPRLPEGDVVVLFERTVSFGRRVLDRAVDWQIAWRLPAIERLLTLQRLQTTETLLGSLAVAGLLLLSVLLSLWIAMA